MTDNSLAGSELKHLTKYTNMKVIKFANNKVKDLSEIEALKPLTNLLSLDLNENPVCNVTGYKEAVFGMFPELQLLDGLDKEGNEMFSEDEEEDDDYGNEEPEAEGAEQGEDDEDGEFDDYDDEEDGEDDQDIEEDELGYLGKRK